MYKHISCTAISQEPQPLRYTPESAVHAITHYEGPFPLLHALDILTAMCAQHVQQPHTIKDLLTITQKQLTLSGYKDGATVKHPRGNETVIDVLFSNLVNIEPIQWKNLSTKHNPTLWIYNKLTFGSLSLYDHEQNRILKKETATAIIKRLEDEDYQCAVQLETIENTTSFKAIFTKKVCTYVLTEECYKKGLSTPGTGLLLQEHLTTVKNMTYTPTLHNTRLVWLWNQITTETEQQLSILKRSGTVPKITLHPLFLGLLDPTLIPNPSDILQLFTDESREDPISVLHTLQQCWTYAQKKDFHIGFIETLIIHSKSNPQKYLSLFSEVTNNLCPKEITPFVEKQILVFLHGLAEQGLQDATHSNPRPLEQLIALAQRWSQQNHTYLSDTLSSQLTTLSPSTDDKTFHNICTCINTYPSPKLGATIERLLQERHQQKEREEHESHKDSLDQLVEETTSRARLATGPRHHVEPGNGMASKNDLCSVFWSFYKDKLDRAIDTHTVTSTLASIANEIKYNCKTPLTQLLLLKVNIHLSMHPKVDNNRQYIEEIDSLIAHYTAKDEKDQRIDTLLSELPPLCIRESGAR